MKTSIKTITAAMMAGVMMASCIDNEVSPEVKQMREHQAALLQAQVELAAAEVAIKEYEAALKELEVARAEAMTDVYLAEQETLLQQEAQDLHNAIQALKVKVGTDAAAMLTSYQAQMGLLQGEVSVKLAKEATIAQQKALLESADAPWEVTKAQVERRLGVEQGRLAAQETALAALKAAAAAENKADVEAQLAEIQADIEEHQDLAQALNIERAEKEKLQTEASQALTAAQATIYGDLTTTGYLEYKALLADQIGTVTGAQNDVASAQLAYDQANTNLASAKTELNAASASYTALKAIYDAAVKDVTAKQAAVEAAQTALDVATNNDNANSTAATQAAKTAAQTALTNAQTALTDAQTKLADADTDDDAPQAEYNNAVINVAIKQNAFDNAEDALQSAKDALSDAKATQADYEAEIARLQPAYDAAIANMDALELAAETTTNAVAEVDVRIAKNNTEEGNLWGVANALENYLEATTIWVNTGNGFEPRDVTMIEEAVYSKTREVEATREAIYSYEVALTGADVAKAEFQDNIATLESDLVEINAKIDSYTKTAAYYLARFNELIAG
jgi:chromosome segregation ATPase